jgi:hypothetical protein
MYAPRHLPGLTIDLLMEEELVLVTTNPEAGPLDDTDYVHVNWGPDFALHHGMSFPMREVKLHITSGRLHLVPGMPRFAYPVYVVRSANADDAILGPALTGLRTVSSEQVQ